MDLYMSTLSQFIPGGKPRQVTVYTSGSGTYTPVSPNSWCYVTMIGGGGPGGGGYACYGTFYGGYGGSGKQLEQWTKVVSTASYSVGAGGYWWNNATYYGDNWQQVAGGTSTFNGLSAAGGGNGGGVRVDGQITSAVMGLGYYTHGGNYGVAGWGTTVGNGNGCTNWSNGGNGNGGIIVVQDFGP
jgi:hypothetical protein